MFRQLQLIQGGALRVIFQNGGGVLYMQES